MTQRDFGSKPFPTQLGNGTPDFILPVADPFRFAGNNVLDGSADFPIALLSATSVPNVGVPEGQGPSVGLVLYGGPRNNTSYGSQASAGGPPVLPGRRTSRALELCLARRRASCLQTWVSSCQTTAGTSPRRPRSCLTSRQRR